MNRPLFARGVRGENIRVIQTALGLTESDVDGRYGKITADAVSGFQAANRMAVTGEVDSDTWQAVTKRPIPAILDRCLQLTAAFEGHGFTLAQGNFDGAGITWGIIGFTLAGGELGALLKAIERDTPGVVRSAFGSDTDELFAVLDASAAEQIAFADRNSLGAQKATLAEPWLSGFRRLGQTPEAQSAQLAFTERRYFIPALSTAASFGLTTELGLALAFDIHVQNGGISDKAAQQIRNAVAERPTDQEQDLRVVIANAVADNAKNVAFREDVRKRKLTIATGSGQVHSETFVLRNWGLGEFAFTISSSEAA